MSVWAAALPDLGEVRPGDDLAALLAAAAGRLDAGLADGDVLCVAHKVVSKAEGRVRALADVAPGERALSLAAASGKDARHIQVVLDEAAEVLRADGGRLICRTPHGFVCANAGVDRSNAGAPDAVVLLPLDPDASARGLRAGLRARLGVAPAVVITDSFGRPWRIGQAEVAIGCAGLTPLDDWRGRSDSDGRGLHATHIAIADEAAAAADLVRTKSSREPAVRLRGLERHVLAGDGPGAAALIRARDQDLFLDVRHDEGMTFAGVIPALLTPFDAGSLALRADLLEENARRLASEGIAHVVVCGTMGEAGTLSIEERAQVIGTALATGLTVTVGISGADTATVERNARQAADAGANGVMCLPPTSYAADDAELDAFFRAVTAASDLPVMLYNNPEAARLDLRPEQIVALARGHERITAIKECSGDARRIARLIELAGDDLEVLIGGDDWALEGYAAGAVGWVSGVANVAPGECLELERSVRAGDLAAARALWPRLAPLARLDMTPKLVQYFKAAQDATGRHGGPTRPPRGPLNAVELAEVDAAIAALGVPATGAVR